jgi:hypothetical protein
VRFNSRDESAWVEHLNIPGILRVGGFETAIACAAPRPLLIHNAPETFDTKRAKELYRMLGASDSLRIHAGQDSDQEILDWLME